MCPCSRDKASTLERYTATHHSPSMIALAIANMQVSLPPLWHHSRACTYVRGLCCTPAREELSQHRASSATSNHQAGAGSGPWRCIWTWTTKPLKSDKGTVWMFWQACHLVNGICHSIGLWQDGFATKTPSQVCQCHMVVGDRICPVGSAMPWRSEISIWSNHRQLFCTAGGKVLPGVESHQAAKLHPHCYSGVVILGCRVDTGRTPCTCFNMHGYT